MGRIVLGVVAGFVLWVGSDQLLIVASPGWYGAHQRGLEQAMADGGVFPPDPIVLATSIVRSVLISLAAGWLAAAAAGERRRTAPALGVVLLAFGTMVEVAVGRYLPLWYHATFLALLVPATLLGARLRSVPDEGAPPPSP